MRDPDVLVAGGGNAGLCAALSAHEQGATVMLLERASRAWRGGNSKYTRNIRCASDRYPEDELLRDLVGVTGEHIDTDVAALTIERSRDAPDWMMRWGIRWQPALRGTLQLDRSNRFFLGGGKALVTTYYTAAADAGIDVRYDACVLEVDVAGDRPRVVFEHDGERVEVRPRAVVAASGGFEANLDWLARYWGDGAHNYVVRGCRQNDGLLLDALLRAGARAAGNPRGFHAIAVDARSPGYDGGIVTRVDAIPFGIVVNERGDRFHDEGEDIWPKRYATWGRLIAEQPGQRAFVVFDARALGRFIPPLYPPVSAGTIPALARALGLDPDRLRATVDAYNRAAQDRPSFGDGRLDGVATEGLTPAKSNWALRLVGPPFLGHALRPGVTFTYLGVAVDSEARVLSEAGRPLPGMFAAGEIMAGNVLTSGYLAGFGMTIGTVFGRIAGRAAAGHARA